MTEDQEKLKKKATKLNHQIHKLEKQKMDLTKQFIKDKAEHNDSEDKIEKVKQKTIFVQIPSTITKSFEILGRVLCSLPPEVSVIKLRANHQATNVDELSIDEDYGITFLSTDRRELPIKYVLKRSIKTTKVENPFNIDIYNKMMKHIDHYLGKFEDHNGIKHAQDLSVEYLELRITDKELQAMAGTETDDFLAFFKTTKHENKKFKKQLIKYHIYVNKEYLFEAGFKHTSLNLVQLIEAEKYHKNKKDTNSSIIHWEGLQDPFPIKNNDIAFYLRYNTPYFPEDFFRLKRFYTTKANVIKMIDGGI